VRRTLFHAPSFSAGVVMGAVVVLGAAYLPELLSGSNTEAASTPAAPVDTPPQLTFEFDDLLRNSRVTADPEPYANEPAEETTAVNEQIVLQAASFRSRDDAERLRAALLLMDLPAATSATTLSNGQWYRVTVGPFDSQVKAQRALTRLREKNIAALWTKRPAQ
jgi:cell division protein FtsN